MTKRTPTDENKQEQRNSTTITLNLDCITEAFIGEYKAVIDDETIIYKALSKELIELLIAEGVVQDIAFQFGQQIQNDTQLSDQTQSEFAELARIFSESLDEMVKNSIDSVVERSMEHEYRHPVIEFCFTKNRDSFSIDIEDNGTGFDQKFLEKFNDSKHLEAHVSGKGYKVNQLGGAGQGLHILKTKVIQQLQGTISGNNVKETGGARITITIPESSLTLVKSKTSSKVQPRLVSTSESNTTALQENNQSMGKIGIPVEKESYAIVDIDFDDETENREAVNEETDEQTIAQTNYVIGTPDNLFQKVSPKPTNTDSASKQTSHSCLTFGNGTTL